MEWKYFKSLALQWLIDAVPVDEAFVIFDRHFMHSEVTYCVPFWSAASDGVCSVKFVQSDKCKNKQNVCSYFIFIGCVVCRI